MTVGRLEPVNKGLVSNRIFPLVLPGQPFLLGHRTHTVLNQKLKHDPLAHLAAELHPPSHTLGTPDCRRRLQRVIGRINSLWEDHDALVKDISCQIVKDSPSQRVRPQIESKRFLHKIPVDFLCDIIVSYRRILSQQGYMPKSF